MTTPDQMTLQEIKTFIESHDRYTDHLSESLVGREKLQLWLLADIAISLATLAHRDGGSL